MAAKILTGLFVITSMLYAGKWQKEFTEDGVTVWSRSLEGTKVIQVKAYTVVKQNPDVIWAGLQEDGKFLKCMPNVIVKKDFEKCGDTCKLTFQKIHRAPLKDRTYVIKVTWKRTEEDGKIVIHHSYKQVKGHKMATSNGMEVDNIFGRWELVSDDGQKTKFTYINHVDLGGLVPTGLVNKSLKENAAKFLKNLKAQAPSWK
jgi:carbon monoxide dehydrogenase subunit G